MISASTAKIIFMKKRLHKRAGTPGKILIKLDEVQAAKQFSSPLPHDVNRGERIPVGPKGVFRFKTHEEADEWMEKWRAEREQKLKKQQKPT